MEPGVSVPPAALDSGDDGFPASSGVVPASVLPGCATASAELDARAAAGPEGEPVAESELEGDGDGAGGRDCDAEDVGGRVGEARSGFGGGDEFGRRVMAVIAPPTTMTGTITMRMRRECRCRKETLSA